MSAKLNRYRIWEIHNETGHKEFYINLAAGDDEEANKRLRELQECCNKHNDNVTLQMKKRKNKL
jgi:hypothetical protein